MATAGVTRGWLEAIGTTGSGVGGATGISGIAEAGSGKGTSGLGGAAKVGIALTVTPPATVVEPEFSSIDLLLHKHYTPCVEKMQSFYGF